MPCCFSFFSVCGNCVPVSCNIWPSQELLLVLAWTSSGQWRGEGLCVCVCMCVVQDSASPISNAKDSRAVRSDCPLVAALGLGTVAHETPLPSALVFSSSLLCSPSGLYFFFLISLFCAPQLMPKWVIVEFVAGRRDLWSWQLPQRQLLIGKWLFLLREDGWSCFSSQVAVFFYSFFFYLFYFSFF